MNRFKAKTPSPQLNTLKLRVRPAKSGAVAMRLAQLDDLITRAEQSGYQADKLATAICGEQAGAPPWRRPGAEPPGMANALAARAMRLAQALDRCDVALNRALAALG